MSPRKLAELPNEIKEALALHEMLRRLNFDRDYIYVTLAPTTEGCSCGCCRKPGPSSVVAVVLRMPNRADFTIHAARTEITRRDFAPLWMDAVIAWNAAPVEECMLHYKASEALKHDLDLIVALTHRGFEIDTRHWQATQTAPVEKQ